MKDCDVPSEFFNEQIFFATDLNTAGEVLVSTHPFFPLRGVWSQFGKIDG